MSDWQIPPMDWLSKAAGIELDAVGTNLKCDRRALEDDFVFRHRLIDKIIDIQQNGLPKKKPNNVSRLVPMGKLGTCATVVDDIVDRLDTMEEIYCVVKDKDGTSQEYFCGKLDGLTFAILVLQDLALKALNGKAPE